MYVNKKNNSIYFHKKRKKAKKINLYIYLFLIFIFVFFIFFNLNFNKYSEIKNKNFIKKIQNDDLLPPKPKEKWQYIHILENL